jgi:N-acetylglucosaminyl-diphospho-decaprenol L-rhamnosyltransferase
VLGDDSARYVLILNEDTELEPDAVTRLVRFSDQRREVGVAGPEIYRSDGSRQPSYFRFPRLTAQIRNALLPARPPRRGIRHGWLNGSCLLLRTAAIRDVGPFDERFFIFYEDTDLGYRMAKSGWESTVVEAARIVHHGHQTVSRPALGSAMERQMLRSRYLYFRKHCGRWAADVMSLGVRLALVGRAAWSLVTSAGRGEGRRQARLLTQLARQSPRVPLAHEAIRPSGSDDTP